jgi:hypothetical protein
VDDERDQHEKRGIRNHNPGNIRQSDDDWLGLSTHQSDPEFFQFVSAEFGIRAMARVLMNYQTVHKLDTVRQLVSRWAPMHENPTDNYAAFVAQRVGVKPDQPIVVTHHLTALVNAIIEFENGNNPYSPDQVGLGVKMALGECLA